MGTMTILYWNVENIGLGANPGTGKYNLTGPEITQFIAKVVTSVNASIVGLNEIRSNLGATLGPALATSLGSKWQGAYSPQFTDSRLEQYIFLWNTRKVTNYKAFQHVFPNPAPPPTNLGFPGQIGSDRPPFLGFFQTTTGTPRKFAVAAFHAPSPGYWNGVKKGNQALGLVNELATEADTCVVMGDCNIKYNADVTVNESYGWHAFTPLVGRGFTQRIPQPILTSLITYQSAYPTMTIQDAYNQPYDQIFFRTNAGYSCDAGREELLVECQEPRYLSNTLKDIQAKWEGKRPVLYNSVEEVFVPFRKYVSDHMPVVADITYP